MLARFVFTFISASWAFSSDGDLIQKLSRPIESVQIHVLGNGGHGGRVVTLSPPTSEAGVRSPHGLKWESW